jgi:hypothetical protein
MAHLEILAAVEGVEPFSSTLREVFLQLESNQAPLRWRARHTFMAFMLEHGVEFMDRWPQFIPDLREILDCLWEKGLGRPQYRENLAQLREIVRIHTMVK